jgi:hypothetical protein
MEKRYRTQSLFAILKNKNCVGLGRHKTPSFGKPHKENQSKIFRKICIYDPHGFLFFNFIARKVIYGE